ncbi:carbohydrate ABC transporter permease [Actinomadura scrupuli]|uniref:carbohydrate ABC transporter permease n=1 Tax=Actinomadura scrupuli TaxID=559629 RepID=UPI003D997D6D
MALQSPARPGAGPYRLVGLLLAVPAALAALISLVLPTGQTILRSFQRGGIFGGRTRSVGLRNYTALLGDGDFWSALGFSLSLAVVPFLVAMLVGPSLAAALDQAGTWPRRAGRVLLSLPLVVFSPVAVAAAWLEGQRDGGIAGVFGSLPTQRAWTPTLPLITAAATFGLVCGLALLVFLPVMRGRAEGRPLTPTMLAVGSLTALASVAVALQAFSFGLVMSMGRQATLATMQYRLAFVYADFGRGSAVATMTGLLLGVLGVAATIIAVRTGLRIELRPVAGRSGVSGPAGAPPEPVRDPRRATAGGTIIGVLALVVVVVIALVTSWPWLSAVLSSEHTPPLRTSAMRIYANTWVPPLLGAAVSVGVAFLAALGIGGLRPFGRHSEWCLLPFAPWLFVGLGPLSIAGFENLRHLKLLNTFVGLIPPALLSVPALVVLTLFFRTRSAEWRMRASAGAPALPAFFRVVVLPALPLAALLGGASVLLGAHGLLWPLLVGSDPDDQTAPVALFQELGAFGLREPSTGLVTPILVVVVVFLVLAALQVLYLDRLVISTGPAGEATDPPKRTVPPMPQPHWPGPGAYGPPPGPPAPPGAYGPPPGPPAPPGGHGPPPGRPPAAG